MHRKTVVTAAVCCLAAVSLASTARRTPVVEAVEKVLPSVVNLGTERIVKVRYTDPTRRFRGDLFDQFFSEFFGHPMAPAYRKTSSLGSGVIIDPRGYILTNFHVIERASRIRVTLSDESVYDAEVLAGDELNDLALIKIEPRAPLTAVEFGNDDDLMLGETVIALGNPFGLAHTVTVGVLSSKTREARYGGEVLYKDILQTDAAINPGSSGGPLLNIDGQLIGINMAIYREAQNIGFAMPVSRARALLAQWLSPRNLAKMAPGFEAADRDGVVKVTAVDPKALPAGSDLQPGDIIRGVGGQRVADLLELDRSTLDARPGDRITLTVERDGRPHEVEVVMAALPKPDGRALAKRLLGLELSEQAVPGSGPKGVPISGVTPGAAAAKAGVRPGLLVTRVNQFQIATLDDVGRALENVRAGDAVAVGLLSVEERGAFIVAQSSLAQLKAE